MKRILTLLLASTIFSSCYYDKLEELYPGGVVNPCDPALPATYTGSIEYIINFNCVSCHSSKNPSGNVALTNYDEVKSYAASGLLLNVIERKAGVKAMPPSQSLPSCQIEKIKTWIESGTPQ